MIPLTMGFFADIIFGDPHFLPHPVRLIGKAIEWGEAALRHIFPSTEKGELMGGVCLTFFIVCVSFFLPWLILCVATKVHPVLAICVEGFMCYQVLAVKSLKIESMKVAKALETGTLEEARRQVSMIVGRDTAELTEEQVAKAAIETVAENTADGVVAPMLFLALGGAPLGFLYKAVNTMDSMIGYQNHRYLYFGRAAARLDDILNFIPARMAAIFMIVSSAILGMDYKNALRVFQRDRCNHASPNSAQTEAVCAGALDIQLAGDAYYFGQKYSKKTIGDEIRSVEYQDIERANRLLYGAALLCFGVCICGMEAARWVI